MRYHNKPMLAISLCRPYGGADPVNKKVEIVLESTYASYLPSSYTV